MEKWTWKQWTSMVLIILTILSCVIMHLVQPQVSYAFAETMTLIGVIVGFIAGYLFKREVGQTQIAGNNSTQIQIK